MANIQNVTVLSSITCCSIDRERSRDVVENGYNSTRLRPLKDGFHNVEISPRDRTAVLSCLLDKVRFSCSADTSTSVPCTSYYRVPVFGFAAAASTHQTHLVCISSLLALPRLAICGVSWSTMNQSELAFGLPVIIIGQDAALTVASSQLHCISTYSTNRST